MWNQYQQLQKAFVSGGSHPFEDELQVDRNVVAALLESFDGVKPGQNRAFAIGSSASNQLLTVVADGQLERLGAPAVVFYGGLNVKVAIDDQSFFLRVLAQLAEDHRGKLEVGLVGSPGS